MTPLIIIAIYLGLLLALGLFAGRFSRGTGKDYMLASHTIGPFLLLMSLFGTTMTAFALVGSTGEAWQRGVVVYGLLASSSAIVHPLCFFLLGIKLWAFGRRHGYTTQIEFFRDRLENEHIGLLLFPILVGLVIPYLLIGVISAGAVMNGVSAGAFPGWEVLAPYRYGLPPWFGSLLISAVVLAYVFFGGMRATAWANAFQTLVFLILGVVTFIVIAHQLGGVESATSAVLESQPDKLKMFHNPGNQLVFISYLLIPASVGMFPHVFQHWLTAKSANSFKLPVIAHPLFIMILWAPCVMVGVWATSAQLNGQPLVPADPKYANRVLVMMVDKLTRPELTGLLSAGILAAIMSSLDSQFLCIGSIFTKDIVQHYWHGKKFSERQIVWMARGFVVMIVAVTFLLSLAEPRSVFALGIWCFSGFTGLVPLAFAAVYWRRLTAAGAYASVLAVVVSWGYLFWQSDFALTQGYQFFGLMPVVVITACSTTALVFVSLLTKPPNEATLAKFFERGRVSAP